MFEYYRASGPEWITPFTLPHARPHRYPEALKRVTRHTAARFDQQHPPRLIQGATTVTYPPDQPPRPGQYGPPQQQPYPVRPPKRLADQWWLTPLILLGGLVLLLIGLSQQGVGSSGMVVLAYLAVPVAVVVLIVRALMRSGTKQTPRGMSAPITAGMPPGWYRDGQGQMRWFDGIQWTGMTRP